MLRKVTTFYAIWLDKRGWRDGLPGQPGPIYRTAMADYIVAGLVRDIAKFPSLQEHATSLHATAKDLASSASNSLVGDWEEGDDICPPWPFRFGPHFESAEGDPKPLPWLPVDFQLDTWVDELLTPAMTNTLLAYALRRLASITSNDKASQAIAQAGEVITKSAGSTLYDEYRATPVRAQRVSSEIAVRAAV
jgi:hypothetical protein